MTALNDAKHSALVAVHGPGHIGDLWSLWLGDQIGVTAGHVVDRESEFLTSKGFGPVDRNDGWYGYLGSLGHTESMNDRWLQWWAAFPPI
jgi:hypothetical protein